MWEGGGILNLRHYTGTSWDTTENLGPGNYPNLKLGVSGNRVERTNTHCSGAPFRLMTGSRNLGPVDEPPSVSISNPVEGSSVSGDVPIQIDATDVEDPAGSLNVQWNVDGGVWQNAIYNGGTGYYEDSWDTTTVSNDTHTINPLATDSSLNSINDVTNVSVENLNVPPTATFIYSCDGLRCDFDASGSTDSDGTIVTYVWDFGMGLPGAASRSAIPTWELIPTQSNWPSPMTMALQTRTSRMSR